MRPIEFLILSALFLTLVGTLVPARRRPRFLVYLPGLAVLLAVVHLVVEKYRWQMVPAYALTVVLFLVSVVLISRDSSLAVSRGRAIATVFGAVVGLLVLAFAAFLPTFMPIVDLPEPTGPYAVGRTTIRMVDDARPETLTDDPNDVREFDADFWYPAGSVDGCQRAAYQTPTRRIDSIVAEGAEDLGGPGPPGFFFDYLALMGTNSYVDAPPAGSGTGFPVIAFTPGFLSSHDNGQVFFEELASHGYVVFATSQPYEHASVGKPDGTVVPYSREHLEALKHHMKEVPPLLQKLYETEDEGEKSAIVREVLEIETFFDNNVKIRTGDIGHVLDQLERMDTGDVEGPFTGRLDLSRIGVFGHSLGGSTAGQVCVADHRVDACVNLDGYPFGDLMSSSIDQPYMIMYSESFSGEMDPVFESCEGPAYKATVAETTHSDYSDEPWVMPFIKRIGMSGPIDAGRMIRITNDYLLSFFDRFLKGSEDSFPLKAGAYPGVAFEEMTRHDVAD